MVKASEVIGRRVVVREGGEEAGKIKDVITDPGARQVIGFVIAEGLIGTKVARWTALQAIGPDSVIFSAAGSIVKAGDAPDIKSVLDKDLHVRGLQLQTTQGKELGKIEDFRFDERTGAIEGFELGGGLFSRKSFMPAPLSLEIGKDLAFVAPEVEETIQES